MARTLLVGGNPSACRPSSERRRNQRRSMTRTALKGLNGSNPLGFMASVGLLRLFNAQNNVTRLGFMQDGTFQAWIECDLQLNDIAAIVAKDAKDAADQHPWRLEYQKQEKRGIKVVADLKAP